MIHTKIKLDRWREARVRPIDLINNRHTIHSYFNTCPESPDGHWVLAFSSTQPRGEVGDIVVIDRHDHHVRVLATDVTCEDSHRQAYQQWTAGGRYVVYQDLREGQWHIHRVNLASGANEVLATGWQMAFGRPDHNTVPLHGPHWHPGDNRDLMLLDTETGSLRVGVTNDAIRQDLPDFVQRHHGDKPTSIFFPIISPSGQRAFFKLASVKSGQFQTAGASVRPGIIVYDFAKERVLFHHDQWGHPAWSPDSNHIITPWDQQLHEINCDANSVAPLKKLPEVPGSHPNYCPANPELVVTDAYLRGENIPRGWWGVWIGRPESGETVWLHKLNELPGGEMSWRPPHPHPVFSADGNRLYFNVTAGQWTRLHMAEI